MQEFIESLKRFKNKVRIWFLRIFTNRVKVVQYTDEKGDTHTVTAEQQTEKLCQHNQIKQLYGTFWYCVDCPDVYFEITYKVALSRTDLLGFLEAAANHLKAESPLSDDATPQE